jgi:hypothetical protein
MILLVGLRSYKHIRADECGFRPREMSVEIQDTLHAVFTVRYGLCL